MISGVDANDKPTSAPARFLFATEDGTIVGWNPGVNPKGFTGTAGTFGIIAVDNSGNNFTMPPSSATGAVYLAIARMQMARPACMSPISGAAWWKSMMAIFTL